MHITLELKGPLKKYGPDKKQFQVELKKKETTVKEIIDQLNVPASSISFILVAGRKAPLETILEGGEVVIVNPRVVGG